MDIARLIVTVALAAAFVFMGIAHFVPASARTMAAMIPERMRFVSARRLVQFTGLCEIAGGIGLLTPLRPVAALALIVFLVAVFPANAYAARNPEKFGKAAFPFWPRLAAQVALIALLAWIAL